MIRADTLRTSGLTGAVVSISLLGLGGCVEPFSGSHLQVLLRGAAPPCEVITQYALKAPKPCRPGTSAEARMENRFLYHYAVWGTVNSSAVTHLASFNVQPQIIPDELLKLERDGAKTSLGEPIKAAHNARFVDMSPADQSHARSLMDRAAAVMAITSHGTRRFQAEAGKETWLDPDFYVGGYIELMLPHNGTIYGHVEGKHPYGGGVFIGGAAFKAGAALKETVNSIVITIEPSEVGGAVRGPSEFVYLRGVPQAKTRGVISVDLSSPVDQNATGNVAIFPALGVDDEYF